MRKIPVGEGGVLGGFTLRRYGPVYPAAEAPTHQGHKHYIDHLTYVEMGSIKVGGDDGEEILARAGEFVLIRAGNRHDIWAMEPRTSWCCMFSEAEAVKWMEQENIKRADAKLAALGVPESDDARVGLRSMIFRESGEDEILHPEVLPKYARAKS